VDPADTASRAPRTALRPCLDGMTNVRHPLACVRHPNLVTASLALILALVVTGSASNGPVGASIVPTTRLGQHQVGLSKILVIMEENHSIGQVFPSQMPYLWSLAQQYGRATSWSDISHPSLPNYLAIFGGSAFNDPQDCLPAPGCTYPGPSVFGQAVAHGASARAYQESMPTPCDLSNSGNYDVNHNPWVYFPDESRLCRQNDVPAGTIRVGALLRDTRTGSLPAVGEISPNLIHDGHDGTLAQADGWLHTWVPVLTSGSDWRAGRLAIVVVFDEGETTEQVPFVILAPGVSHRVVRSALNHFALTRLIDEIVGVPPLGDASHAADLAPMLGLHL
jgi:phosphatidylinositol-3-phosphatase